MAKNTIIMIGDGMGWEMARAAAIYKQIQEGKSGNTLADFYTSGKGTGLNMQTLTGWSIQHWSSSRNWIYYCRHWYQPSYSWFCLQSSFQPWD